MGDPPSANRTVCDVPDEFQDLSAAPAEGRSTFVDKHRRHVDYSTAEEVWVPVVPNKYICGVPFGSSFGVQPKRVIFRPTTTTKSPRTEYDEIGITYNKPIEPIKVFLACIW